MSSIANVPLWETPRLVFSVDPLLKLELKIKRLAMYAEAAPIGGFVSPHVLQAEMPARFSEPYCLEARLRTANAAVGLTASSPEMQAGFFQANLHELVCYSAALCSSGYFVDKQRKYPIVALGTPIGPSRNPGCAYIHGAAGYRYIGTTLPIGGQRSFSRNCLALLVRLFPG